MPSQKLQKKLPSRVSNAKAKAKRERSWARNLQAKATRVSEQQKREHHNRQVGSTGKQRRYNPKYSSV